MARSFFGFENARSGLESRYEGARATGSGYNSRIVVDCPARFRPRNPSISPGLEPLGRGRTDGAPGPKSSSSHRPNRDFIGHRILILLVPMVRSATMRNRTGMPAGLACRLQSFHDRSDPPPRHRCRGPLPSRRGHRARGGRLLERQEGTRGADERDRRLHFDERLLHAPQLEVAYGVQPLLQRGIDGRGETVVLPELAESQLSPPRVTDLRRTSPSSTVCSTCRPRACGS